MDTRHNASWAVILLASMIALGGCGLSNENAPDPETASIEYPVNAGTHQTLNLLRGTASVYDIYSVNPNQGFLPGGEQIHLSGSFPYMVGAESIYTVYFGLNQAAYAPLAQAFDMYNIYVIAPPGDAVGLVDVNLYENAADIYIASEPNGYEYIDPFQVTDVDPALGPIGGGNGADVIGFFPVSSPIDNLAAAANAYTVYFGSEIASFRQIAPTDPIITSTNMYVTVPAKPDGIPGFVDVTVAVTGALDTYRTLPNGYRYVRDFELLEVIPNSGPFRGGNSVRLNGYFPTIIDPIDNLVLANSLYTVYFGTERAAFNPSISPIISSSDMYVVAPQAISLGEVDVRIFSTIDGIYNTYQSPIDDNYTYQRIMEIYSIYPSSGPLSGGNLVRIEGNFPVESTVTSMVAAASYYNVFFEDNLAPFSGNGASPTTLYIEKAIGGIYNHYDILHIAAPPGNVLGFVDVSVVDLSFTDPPIKAIDGYQYLIGNSFGTWVDCDVYPNPVGPMRSGDLSVRIEVTGTFSDSFQAYIVPQGGEPGNPDHRIELVQDTTLDMDDTDKIWYGTNKDNIETIHFTSGTDTLYADGHGAVYLEEDGNIVGDDYSAPYLDSGRIGSDAHEGRHFIIDTIPPVMWISDTPGTEVGADNFITFNLADYPTVPGFRPINVPPSSHPYIGTTNGGAFTQFGSDFPIDDGVISAIPLDNPDGMQKFFNVASISNELLPPTYPAPDNHLQFEVTVIFEDQDVYTALEVDPSDSTLNGDRFNGDSTVRQVAGFGDNPISFSGTHSTALQFNDIPISETDEFTSPMFLARWVLQPGSTRLPDIANVDVTFTPFGSVSSSPLLNDSTNFMTAVWDLTGTDADSGIDPIEVDGNMHLVVKFASADRATAYFPKGDKDESPRFTITEDERLLDPLHLWWMREANTEFVRNNVPSSGVTQNPSFTWSLTSVPRPEVTEVTSATGILEPVYTYQIWRTPVSQDKDKYRDSFEYDVISNWEPWSNSNTLNNLVALTGDNMDRWYLIVVQGVDEAGNAELFPAEVLPLIDSASMLDYPTSNSGPNWQRFYVPSKDETLETEITPLFWHNTDDFPLSLTIFDLDSPEGPKTGELNFGSETVIPLPPANVFFPAANTPTVNYVNQRVEARFNIRVLSNLPSNNININWALYQEGKLIDSGVFANQNFASLIYPGTTSKDFYLGDGNRAREVNYLFRAWATDIDNSAEDSTPASIRFVVVPDVGEYIRNRQTEDEQPIKEFDRP